MLRGSLEKTPSNPEGKSRQSESPLIKHLMHLLQLYGTDKSSSSRLPEAISSGVSLLAM